MRQSPLSACAIAVGIVWLSTPANAFVPSTLFSEKVSVIASYDPTLHSFVYSYTLSNSVTSAQNIWIFGVRYGGSAAPVLQAPTNWTSDLRLDYQPIANWGGGEGSSGVVPPGAQKSGFRMTDSQLPGIQDYYAQSDNIVAPENPDEEQKIEDQGLLFFPNDWKSGKTVGPSNVPPYKDPRLMLEYIAGQKEEAFGLGWIDSKGIENSLDVKLDAARRSLERGNPRAAVNEIRAFQHEVTAQEGKHLNQSAAMLLTANVQYIQVLLP